MKYKLKPQIFNLCVLFFFAQEANSFGQMVVQIECFVNMTTSHRLTNPYLVVVKKKCHGLSGGWIGF